MRLFEALIQEAIARFLEKEQSKVFAHEPLGCSVIKTVIKTRLSTEFNLRNRLALKYLAVNESLSLQDASDLERSQGSAALHPPRRTEGYRPRPQLGLAMRAGTSCQESGKLRFIFRELKH